VVLVPDKKSDPCRIFDLSIETRVLRELHTETRETFRAEPNECVVRFGDVFPSNPLFLVSPRLRDEAMRWRRGDAGQYQLANPARVGDPEDAPDVDRVFDIVQKKDELDGGALDLPEEPFEGGTHERFALAVHGRFTGVAPIFSNRKRRF
jgi:hypothetical protein